MTDPRTSTALHHLPLHDPPPNRLVWSIVLPDPSGPVQVPAEVVDLLGTGPRQARVVDGVSVLGPAGGPGRHVGIDKRGRLYVPVWLRRRAVAAGGRGVNARRLRASAVLAEARHLGVDLANLIAVAGPAHLPTLAEWVVEIDGTFTAATALTYGPYWNLAARLLGDRLSDLGAEAANAASVASGGPAGQLRAPH
jgi:hypothetical protein